MVIAFVLLGISMRKPIGAFKVVYEYANRLVTIGHQVNAIHLLMIFVKEGIEGPTEDTWPINGRFCSESF